MRTRWRLLFQYSQWYSGQVKGKYMTRFFFKEIEHLVGTENSSLCSQRLIKVEWCIFSVDEHGFFGNKTLLPFLATQVVQNLFCPNPCSVWTYCLIICNLFQCIPNILWDVLHSSASTSNTYFETAYWNPHKIHKWVSQIFDKKPKCIYWRQFQKPVHLINTWK